VHREKYYKIQFKLDNIIYVKLKVFNFYFNIIIEVHFPYENTSKYYPIMGFPLLFKEFQL